MASEFQPEQDVSKIWQSQKSEGVRMSVDEIRLKAGKYNRKILWRNAREYVAAVAVTVFFSFSFTQTNDTLTRVAYVAIIASVLYICWHLHQHGSASRMPENLGMANSLEFHRQELERQRDLVSGVWRWYLGPMIPGMVLLLVALARTNPGHVKNFGVVFTAYACLVVLVFAGVGWMNLRAARRLQRRIDDLDKLRGDPGTPIS